MSTVSSRSDGGWAPPLHLKTTKNPRLMKLTKPQTNYAAIYLAGFLVVSLLAFITNRDSCANPDYRAYMGAHACQARN